jgi:hypothetical protein
MSRVLFTLLQFSLFLTYLYSLVILLEQSSEGNFSLFLHSDLVYFALTLTFRPSLCCLKSILQDHLFTPRLRALPYQHIKLVIAKRISTHTTHASSQSQ